MKSIKSEELNPLKGHSHHIQKSESPDSKDSMLRLVAWEITRNCNLECIHCRAAATKGPYTGELDTKAGFKLLDQMAELGEPIVILTGGEPLLRQDIFEIAKYGTKKNLRMVMAPNGTLITDKIADKLVESGIKRISISLDGASKESHDKFRGVKGAFDGALNGIHMPKMRVLSFKSTPPLQKQTLIKFPPFSNWPLIWAPWPTIFFFWFPPVVANIS
jgi:AdoMet-dependent heme synthase